MIRISKEIYDSLSDEELFILKLIEEIKSLEKEIMLFATFSDDLFVTLFDGRSASYSGSVQII